MDEISWGDYYTWMGQFLDESYRVLVPGGTIALVVPQTIKWQSKHKYASSWEDYDPDYKVHKDGTSSLGKGRIEPLGFHLFEMMQSRDSHMREPIIWVKGDEGNCISSNYCMGCDSDPYVRSTHEMILLGSKERWFHRGGTGRRGKEAMPFMDDTKDVWFIPPVSSKSHPAPFPIELPRRLIRLFTHAKDSVVLDPFAGSGTTCLAAKELERNFIGIEQSMKYVEMSKARLN